MSSVVDSNKQDAFLLSTLFDRGEGAPFWVDCETLRELEEVESVIVLSTRRAPWTQSKRGGPHAGEMALVAKAAGVPRCLTHAIDSFQSESGALCLQEGKGARSQLTGQNGSCRSAKVKVDELGLRGVNDWLPAVAG